MQLMFFRLFKLLLWLMLISLDTVSVTVLDLRTDITITNIARHFIEAAPWHNISSENLFVFPQV